MGKLLPEARIRDENGLINQPKQSVPVFRQVAERQGRYINHFDEWCIREEARLNSVGLSSAMDHIPKRIYRSNKNRRNSLWRL